MSIGLFLLTIAEPMFRTLNVQNTDVISPPRKKGFNLKLQIHQTKIDSDIRSAPRFSPARKWPDSFGGCLLVYINKTKKKVDARTN